MTDDDPVEKYESITRDLAARQRRLNRIEDKLEDVRELMIEQGYIEEDTDD